MADVDAIGVSFLARLRSPNHEQLLCVLHSVRADTRAPLFRCAPQLSAPQLSAPQLRAPSLALPRPGRRNTHMHRGRCQRRGILWRKVSFGAQRSDSGIAGSMHGAECGHISDGTIYCSDSSPETT